MRFFALWLLSSATLTACGGGATSDDGAAPAATSGHASANPVQVVPDAALGATVAPPIASGPTAPETDLPTPPAPAAALPAALPARTPAPLPPSPDELVGPARPTVPDASVPGEGPAIGASAESPTILEPDDVVAEAILPDPAPRPTGPTEPDATRSPAGGLEIGDDPAPALTAIDPVEADRVLGETDVDGGADGSAPPNGTEETSGPGAAGTPDPVEPVTDPDGPSPDRAIDEGDDADGVPDDRDAGSTVPPTVDGPEEATGEPPVDPVEDDGFEDAGIGAVATPRIEMEPKGARIVWDDAPGATHYHLLINANGTSGYSRVGSRHGREAQGAFVELAMHRSSGTSFVLQTCTPSSCEDSSAAALDADDLAAGVDVRSRLWTPGDDWSAFGERVEVDDAGRTMAVLSSRRDDRGSHCGVVDVFSRSESEWSLVTQIVTPDIEQGGGTGCDLSLSGDGTTLAVGNSFNSDSEPGQVVVYRHTWSTTTGRYRWEHERTIDGPEPGAGFGNSVSLNESGDRLAVGAPFASRGGRTTGGVSVYRKWEAFSWLPYGELGDGPGGNRWDYFGTAVELDGSGEVLAVGVPGEDLGVGLLDSGAVAIYRDTDPESRSGTWNREAYLQPSGGAVGGASFGSALSIGGRGDLVAVASRENEGTFRLHAHDGTGWNESPEAIIEAPVGRGAYANKGDVRLSADGSTLAVTANSGRGVYLSEREDGAWSVARGVFPAPDDQGSRYMGTDVSADGDVLVIGVPDSDGDYSRVYTY